MFGRETRMLLRHYLDQGSKKSALARQFGVSRDTIHRWIREGDLDRDLDAEPVRYGPRRSVATKLAAYKPIIEARLAAFPELSAVRLLAEIRAAGYTGGYTQLKAFVHRVRPMSPPEPVIRDAGGPTGAGRLCAVSVSLGHPLRLARCPRLLAPAVVPVLSASGYGDADRRPRRGLRLLRRRSAGAALRSDESGHHARPAAGRWRARPQWRVSPVRAPLGLHPARVSALSGADQRQSRAARPLRARQFRLWPHISPRCRSRSPAAVVARARGERAPAWDDPRAPPRPLRSRGALPPAAAGAAPLHVAGV